MATVTKEQKALELIPKLEKELETTKLEVNTWKKKYGEVVVFGKTLVTACENFLEKITGSYLAKFFFKQGVLDEISQKVKVSKEILPKEVNSPYWFM